MTKEVSLQCPGVSAVSDSPPSGELPFQPSILKQIAIVVGAQGGLGACGFATGMITARILGPAARGELAAIQLCGSLLATFATLGLSEAITLYCARDPTNARRHISSAILLSLIIGAPILFLGYLLMPYLLSAQTPLVVRAARWYLLILLFYVLFGFPLGAMRGLGDFTLWSAFRYVTPAAAIVALGVAWSTRQVNPEFIAYLTLAMMGLLSLPIAFYILWRRVRGPLRPDPRSWIPMLGFGVPLVAAALPKNLNLRLDQLVMAALLPPRLLGLYVVAAAWSTMTGPILEGVGIFLFPHIASYKSPEGQARALAQITKLATPVALAEVVIFAVLTPWGVPLIFGHSYQESIPAALVLVGASATLYLGQLLEEGLRGLGKPMPILWAECGGLIVTAISLFALLKPMGIVGAAIASMLGYAIVWSLLVIQTRTITGLSITEILLPNGADIRYGWARLRQLCCEG